MKKNFLYKKFGKRIFDLTLASILFIPFTIISVPFLILVWVNDKSQPLYLAKRIGKRSKEFNLFKIRSMVSNADKSEVISTKKNDIRITKIGLIIRKYKIDELPQLINIFNGTMSFVGPRPNTFKKGVELYTEKEMQQLNIIPGVTDLSSIVFSDESNILSKSDDPDEDYNQLIRPWKSRLGLIYVNNYSFLLDLTIIILTFFNLFNRKLVLNIIPRIVSIYSHEKDLISICGREVELFKKRPPH